MVQRGGLAGEAERSSEQPGLLVRLPGQLRTAYSPREAEVIAYQGAGARLPAEGLPFHDHRAKTLGGAIDCGSQAGGSCPDDHEIEVPHIRAGVQSKRGNHLERVNDLGIVRIDERQSVEHDHNGKLPRGLIHSGEKLLPLLRVRGKAHVRNSAATEYVPQLVKSR